MWSANVDEYDISSISEGMEAAVIVEALGEDELPATVSFVSPTVTTSSMGSSTYAIEIALDDVNTDLRIGMTAQASIVLEAAECPVEAARAAVSRRRPWKKEKRLLT